MSAWEEAVTEFKATPILDAVFPPSQCDDEAADRHGVIARRGGNCVADAEWTPVSSDSPWGGQR